MRTFETLLACALALLLSSSLYGQEPEEFRRRRAALMEELDAKSILILCGANASSRARGKDFRQSSYFFYLSGMRSPGGVLLLHPAAPQGEREILLSNAKKAAAEAGFGRVHPEQKLRATLAEACSFSTDERGVLVCEPRSTVSGK